MREREDNMRKQALMVAQAQHARTLEKSKATKMREAAMAAARAAAEAHVKKQEALKAKAAEGDGEVPDTPIADGDTVMENAETTAHATASANPNANTIAGASEDAHANASSDVYINTNGDGNQGKTVDSVTLPLNAGPQ